MAWCARVGLLATVHDRSATAQPELEDVDQLALFAAEYDHPGVGRRIVVCLESRARRTEDDIDILPAEVFVHRLWEGELT